MHTAAAHHRQQLRALLLQEQQQALLPQSVRQYASICVQCTVHSGSYCLQQLRFVFAETAESRARDQRAPTRGLLL